MKIRIPYDRFRLTRVIAAVMIFFGLQLQVVETFVFNEAASRVLVDRFGADSRSPKGAVQRAMVESGSRRAELTIPSP